MTAPTSPGSPLARLRTPEYSPDDAPRHALVSRDDYRLISADRFLALTASTAADTEVPP